MNTYIVVSGIHGRWVNGNAVSFKPGDEIELTPAEAQRMGDQVRGPVAVAKATKTATQKVASPDSSADWSEFLADNQGTVIESLSELDDDALAQIRAAEVAGRGRKKILAAVDALLKED